MKKKRLLIATDSFLPRWDGIARFLSSMLPDLAEEYDIIVLAPDFPGKKPVFKNVRIVRMPLFQFSIGDFPPAKPQKKLIERYVRAADIIWTQTIGPIGALAIYLGRKADKKVVAYVHSIEWELASASIRARFAKAATYHGVKMFARYIYNKCDLIIVPTKEVGMILTGIGVSTKKTVIHLGINTTKFMPSSNKASSKRKLGIDPSKKVIGFCGRIGREKDLPTLFQAWKSIRADHPNAYLLVVGKGVEEHETMLKSEADVMTIGSTDNVIPYLQAMDVYVLPSLTETTSLSTLEAMSCGLAVAATPVGYIKNYISNGSNGFLFPAKDVLTLASILDKLVRDDSLRIRLGVAARKTVISKHRWHQTVEGIKRVLAFY